MADANPQTLDKSFYIELAAKLITDNLSFIIEGIKNKTKDALSKLAIKTGAAFKDYYRTAISKYFETKTILNALEPIPLYSMYVNIDLIKNKKKLVKTDSMGNLLKVGTHLIVTGTAGSGKSTLLRHLFLNAIATQKQVPLFAELRYLKFNQQNPGDLLHLVYDSLSNLNLKIDLEALESLLDSGHAILFLDGFDELAPAAQDHISLEIINFRDKYHNNAIIVSSRPSERFISWTNFLELTVAQLSKVRALELIDKINYDPEIKKTFRNKVDKDLYDKHVSFLSNPLLLIIMLITFSTYADIPNKLHLFYHQAFETLFQKHDATKATFVRKRYCDLPIDAFQRVLSAFCFQSYVDVKTIFNEAEILHYLNSVDNLYPQLGLDKRCFLQDLLESVCILVKDGLVITFTHRSFQEYFTALFILSLDKGMRARALKQVMNRVVRDTVFQMMFDIDRDIVEKEYIIPTLARLDKSLTAVEDKQIALLKRIFAIAILGSPENQMGYRLKDVGLFELTQFCAANYRLLYPDLFKQVNQAPSASDLADMHKIVSSFGPREMKITELLAHPSVGSTFRAMLRFNFHEMTATLQLPQILTRERQKAGDFMKQLLARNRVSRR